MTTTLPTPTPTIITLQAIEQFLYREARYLDDREFDKWLECYAPTPSSGCRRGTTTTPSSPTRSARSH